MIEFPITIDPGMWMWNIFFLVESLRSFQALLPEFCLQLYCNPISAKFGICAVVGPNGTLVEAKICTFKCPKCVFYLKQVQFTSTTSKFSTNWDESDYSVDHKIMKTKTQKYTIQYHFPSGIVSTCWCGFYSQFLCSQLLIGGLLLGCRSQKEALQ
jgi:hypothetical protein